MKTTLHLHEAFRTPDWEEWMANLPAQVAKLPASDRLHQGRNRVYRVERNGGRFVVKHFLNRGLWKKIAYRISSSKARRSFEHSMRLLNVGVGSPQPVGWREDWRGGFLSESFYVCAYVEVAGTARHFRARANTGWESYLPEVARCIARMHNHGILHRDLNNGNILFGKETGPEAGIYVIDNNRMTFGEVGPRKGIASLIKTKVAPEHRPLFVKAYAEERGLDPEICLALYDRLLGGYTMKRRIKHLTRPWRRKIGF